MRSRTVLRYRASVVSCWLFRDMLAYTTSRCSSEVGIENVASERWLQSRVHFFAAGKMSESVHDESHTPSISRCVSFFTSERSRVHVIHHTLTLWSFVLTIVCPAERSCMFIIQCFHLLYLYFEEVWQSAGEAKGGNTCFGSASSGTIASMLAQRSTSSR